MYKIKRFSKRRNQEDELDNDLKKVGGAAGVIGGGALISNSKSQITGLENLYHSTDSSNVDSILKSGIKSKYAEDPNNITNQVLSDVPMEKKKGKVYLGKSKWVSKGIRGRNDPKILNVNIPYEDLKKMKSVDNPELRGAKNWREFRDAINKRRLIPMNDMEAKIGYDMLGPKGTLVIEGDIDPKYIKGSKNYQKYGLRNVVDYAKKNPGRFAKGVAKGTAGAGLAAGGAYLAYRGIKGDEDKDD